MGATNSNKEVSTVQITCGDSFRIRSSLSAEQDIAELDSIYVAITPDDAESEKLLARTVSLSHGCITEAVLCSGEIVTEFTDAAE